MGSARWRATNVVYVSEAEGKCVKDLTFFEFFKWLLTDLYLPYHEREKIRR
jgi:hypothetical protein